MGEGRQEKGKGNRGGGGMTPAERYSRYGAILFVIMLPILLAITLLNKFQSALVLLLFMMVFAIAWLFLIFLVPPDETRREAV